MTKELSTLCYLESIKMCKNIEGLAKKMKRLHFKYQKTRIMNYSLVLSTFKITISAVR